MRKFLAQSGVTTVSNAAKAISHADFGFTTDNLNHAREAIISTRLAGVQFTVEGTAPTATLGIHIKQNEYFRLEGQGVIAGLKFLREADTDAAVTIILLM